ncbi:MAG: glycosyltransferase family 2 protein [Planctomycetota bacterium]
MWRRACEEGIPLAACRAALHAGIPLTAGRLVEVSVLLPARDAASTLPACLRSLQRQTLTSWECVLVDDGSADQTGDIAAEFARLEPRLRVLRTEPIGLVAALQHGLSECSGALVARMDADDIMHRQRLERQAAVMGRDGDLAAVGCHVRVFPTAAMAAGMREYEWWINQIRTVDDIRREAFVECPVVHPTLMARRDLLLELGYRENGWPEDYDLVLRMLQAGHRLGILPRRLLLWRHHPDRRQRVHPDYGTDRFVALKATFLCGGFLADASDYLLWGYGNTGRSMRRALAEHGRHPACILELHPGRLGNRIHGAEVVAPDVLPQLPRLPLLVSVAGAGPRQQIRDRLCDLGWQELRDYVCVA